MIQYKESTIYIYIITNPAWHNWVKVGRTTRPAIRLDAYQIGSPLRDYIMNYCILSKHPSKIESYFDRNIIGRNEWFHISVEDAKKIIDKIEMGIDIKDNDIPNDCFDNKKGSIHAIYKYKITELEDEYSYLETKEAQSLREVANITHLQIGDLSTKFAQAKHNSIIIGKYEIKRISINPKHSLNWQNDLCN